VPDGFDPATIEARIRRYESFGIHRTGWTGDDSTTDWLVEELRAAGLDATTDRFSFPRVETRTATLTWGAGPRERAEGVPMYDGGFTDFGGIDGELVADDDEDLFGKIVVFTSALRGGADGNPPRGADETFGALAAAGAVGAVVPTGVGDSIRLRNAEYIERPFALPVLQVAPGEIADLPAAMIVGTEGVLEIDGERLQSNATNVVATIEGADAEVSPLVVMTPKSGWFTCAAERGGGIAVWLALAEHLAASSPRRTVHLLASSGHELHHLGLAHWLRSHTAIARRAAITLHLGASIGARHAAPRFGASTEGWHTAVSDALIAEGVDLDAVTPLPAGSPGGGEARNIDEVGGRYVSFLGGHRYFHMPQDTVEQAVDAESVARWARAARTIVDAAQVQPESELTQTAGTEQERAGP
jgi:hypothetical protein